MKRTPYDAEYDRVRRERKAAEVRDAARSDEAERLPAAELKARYGLAADAATVVKDWTGQAPNWSAIAERYRANPGMAARLMEPRILPRASDDEEDGR